MSADRNSFAALEHHVEEDADEAKKQGGNSSKTTLKYPLVWVDLEMTGARWKSVEIERENSFLFEKIPPPPPISFHEHLILLFTFIHSFIDHRFPSSKFAGLDVEKDQILQIACIISDGSLENIVQGEEFTINHPEEILEEMNDWCKINHGKSGLTAAVRSSQLTLAEAEARTLEFIQRHVPEPGAAQIAGNSVHMDVAFMRRHMPRIIDYLHYRLVDVSSIGEVCRRWYPRVYGRAPKKTAKHTAMSDIRESIDQLKYYKRTIFKPPTTK